MPEARLDRLLGYADPLSVGPGETVRFMISAGRHATYRADIVRLICADATPEGPGYKEEVVETALSGEHAGIRQLLRPGSYALIPTAGPAAELRGVTVQAFIWPTLPARGRQGIVTRWSESHGGFGLFVDERGCCAFRVGDRRGQVEEVSTGRRLLARRWYFVAGSCDAAGRLTVRQEALEPLPTLRDGGTRTIEVEPLSIGGAGPILIAACDADGADGPTWHFNGKIDRPRIARRALAPAEMAALKRHAVPEDLADDLLGGWDCSRVMASFRVIDLSPNRLHGVLHNVPTRGVTGHNWTGEALRWRDAPEQYGAIHFHDDDLYDAQWTTSLELTIPDKMRSGMYAARLRAGDDEEYVPFFVRPPRGRATAPLALLVPTATYMAYANYLSWADNPLIEKLFGGLWLAEEDDLFLNEHRELGASTYDSHADGSGICHASRLRPMLNIRPKRLFLWNLNADSHITDALEAMGQAYDVITDEDLHAEGLALLQPYRAVITGTHPEYHSLEMLNALQGYVDQGGRLIYMGGNGFYWRIAFHPERPGLFEVRRCNGTRNWVAQPGEHHHAFDGEAGGTWREQGRTPNRLAGVGFAAEGFDFSCPYERREDSFDPRAAFIFEGIGAGERIGDFGSIGGGAAGLEVDRADFALGTPPHALVLASSVGHSDNYLLVLEDVPLNYPGLGGSENPLVRADMVFFETRAGGAVFATGSIAWAGSLAHNGYDNNVARITANVVRRFLDPRPFDPPDAGETES
jgi:N,N-dimethylformamidase